MNGCDGVGAGEEGRSVWGWGRGGGVRAVWVEEMGIREVRDMHVVMDERVDHVFGPSNCTKMVVTKTD